MNIATPILRSDRLLQVHVLQHCRELARSSIILFVIALAAISLGMSAIADLGLTSLGVDRTERPELFKFGLPGLFVMAVLIAPLFETLLLQQVPILLTNRLGMPVIAQLLAGAVPFAALHFSSGAIPGVAAGAVGGLTYSVAYLTCLGDSKLRAFFTTVAIHSLHNLIPCIFIARELA